MTSRLSHSPAPPKRFAVVVALRNDADHISGLPDVLSRYSVESVWLSGERHASGAYEAWLRAVGRSGARVETVRAGHVRRFGDLEVHVLHPLRDFTGIRQEEQHDAPVVVKLAYGATSILLTGDLDEVQEAALLRHDRSALGVTAVKVSHHGSKNGTTPAFLEAAHPEIAVISIGRETGTITLRPRLLIDIGPLTLLCDGRPSTER